MTARQFALLDSVELCGGLHEQLCVQLRASLRSVRKEAHERLADGDCVPRVRHLEQLSERRCLQLGIVGAQLQLRKSQVLLAFQEILQPLAWWMKLEAVARVRRDERPAPAVLLHPQVAKLGARERCDEVILVEGEAEMVDPRQLPLSRLDDYVHRTTLQLGQAQLEAEPVELVPAVPRLEGGRVLVDPSMAGNEVEAELPR